MNSLFLPQNKLTSVIDDRCDLRTAFHRVLSFYDPNKNKNKKTKVLDCTYSSLWNNKDYKMYAVNKTNNLTGYAKENKYSVIIYEAPRNKTFSTHSLKSAKIFKEIIKHYGIIIVKINDFKEKGNEELKGPFDIKYSFDKNNFYLFDNIIYRHNTLNTSFESTYRSEIIHSYFMIFKPKKA